MRYDFFPATIFWKILYRVHSSLNRIIKWQNPSGNFWSSHISHRVTKKILRPPLFNKFVLQETWKIYFYKGGDVIVGKKKRNTMLLEIKFIKQRWSQFFFGYSVAYLSRAKNSLDQLKDLQLTLLGMSHCLPQSLKSMFFLKKIKWSSPN